MKKALAEVATLRTRDELVRAKNLSDYIANARGEASVLPVSWEAPYWRGVGYFVKQSHVPRGSLAKDIDPSAWLAPAFIDFAKAYVASQHLNNPGETRAGHIKRLQTLRLLEVALLDLRGAADPLRLDAAVLDAAAAYARSQLKGHGPYRVGAELVTLASSLVDRGILPAAAGTWASPNLQPKNSSIGLEEGAGRARKLRLPDESALLALADVFNRSLNVADSRDQADVFTTGAVALLMCAPSRGQEILRLPTNLVFEATDRFGDEQTGLRLHASKGFGAYVKWVWADMVPVASKAIERLRAMSKGARKLALHLEDPASCGRFFRHEDCPNVSDDQPLTKEQVCRALGYKTVGLHKLGLAGVGVVHTLQTLWDGWVLPRHRKANPDFPYVSARDAALGARGGLKFSDALFCMTRHQLRLDLCTSPVLLWMPDLADLGFRLRGAKKVRSVFARYGYASADGQPLTLTSHQIRHLLNTEAQRVGLSDEQIAHWSGRARVSQNAVYDHRTTEERVEQARDAVAVVQAGLSVDQSPDSNALVQGEWVIQVVRPPRSSLDFDDIQPRLTGLKTEYGECHHDWAFAPCEGFVKCLDCSEHACIKGSDEHAATRLLRLEALHRSVLREVAKARLAGESDIDAQDWLRVQERYEAKIAQLIAILRSESVPDGAVIRTARGQAPSHLQRAVRGLATRALTDGSEPQPVMEQLLVALDEFSGSGGSVVAPQLRGGPSPLLGGHG